MSATPGANGLVTVDWNIAGVSAAGTLTFDVDITPDTFVATGDDACGQNMVAATDSCTFVATAAGNYNVTVVPGDDGVDDTDDSDGSDSLTVSSPASLPTGEASDLELTRNGGAVEVSWDPAGVTSWGSGDAADQGFEVTISGGDVGSTDCGEDDELLAKTSTGCEFIPTQEDTTYTVTVTPVNGVGSGDEATDAIVVSSIAPVGELVVTAEADGADVTVEWDSSNVTGATLFDVVIEPATIDDSDCETGIAAGSGDEYSCTFTATAAGNYTATVTPRNSTGSGVPVTSTAEPVASPPTNTALGLELVATADGARVDVTWDPEGVTDWGLGDNPGFVVSVDNTVGANTCGMEADGEADEDARLSSTTDSCSFAATTEDVTYTVTLTPVNTNPNTDPATTAEGTPATDGATVTESAPGAVLDDLDPESEEGDNGAYIISWTAIPDAAWGSGEDRTIDFAVSPTATAADAGASAAEEVIPCGDDMPGDTTSCTFTPSQGGAHTVTLTPKTEFGSGFPIEFSVEVEATGPTGAVTFSEPAVSGSMVTVEWDASDVVWGTGGDRVFKVAITGGAFDAGSCSAELASDATSCQFTAMEAATYTITITPANSEGEATAEDVDVEVVVSAPTARDGTGKLHIFARWSDGSVRTSVQDGTGAWGDWKPLGGIISGEPVVFRNANGLLHFLAIGRDGAIWQKQQLAAGGTDWSSWSSLGGVVRSIAVQLNAGGVAVVVSRAPDNSVWTNRQSAANSTSWAGWMGLGGGVITDPHLTVSGSNLEVRARGLNGEFWHIAHDGTTWGSWAQVDSSTSSASAA